MKNSISKVISIILIVVMVLSLSSCDFWNNTPPDDVEMSYLEDFCYSITTDKEAYDYGEEIEISLSLQFSRRRQVDGLDYVIYLEDSAYYEKLEDREFLFENINQSDYSCEDGSERKFTAKFKIRINDPTYVIKTFKIAVASYSEESKENRSEWFVRPLSGVAYIGDSQGIMVYQMPSSYNHFGGEGHYVNRNFTYGHKELLISSYNREYQAGVSVEELIDRYVRDDYDMKNRIFYYGYYSEDYGSEYFYLSYVSSGVRFKIYVPKDNEYVKLYNAPYGAEINKYEVKKEYLEKFLLFALENGAITEEEYNAEISRISDYEENVIVLGVAYQRIIRSEGIPTKLQEMQDELVFTVPTGDDFYNRVISVEE